MRLTASNKKVLQITTDIFLHINGLFEENNLFGEGLWRLRFYLTTSVSLLTQMWFTLTGRSAFESVAFEGYKCEYLMGKNRWGLVKNDSFEIKQGCPVLIIDLFLLWLYHFNLKFCKLRLIIDSSTVVIFSRFEHFTDPWMCVVIKRYKWIRANEFDH